MRPRRRAPPARALDRAGPRSVVGKNVWGDRQPPAPVPPPDDEAAAAGRRPKLNQGGFTGLAGGGFGDVSFVHAPTPRSSAPESRPPEAPSPTKRTRPLPVLPKLPIFEGGTIDKERGRAAEEASAAAERWVAGDDDDAAA